MTIEEIVVQTGIEKDNIRFYEAEGLIMPKVLEDGQRDYSEDDLQNLLRIKLLRSLDISLEEIKAIKYGNKALTDTLSDQIESLRHENQDSLYALQVCRMLKNDQVAFDLLEAQKYLDIMTDIANGSRSIDVQEETKISKVFYPWRRYFARILDIFLYGTLWSMVLILVFRVSMPIRGTMWKVFDNYFSIGIMLFLEPLLLSKFGTTFGKAVFGMTLVSSKGRNLTYREGLARTWHLIGAGLGYNIPIYNLVRLGKSYSLCEEERIQPWNVDCSYTIKDTKWYRGIAFIGINIVLFVGLILLMMGQQIPPNRGDLTQEEFIENYSYYSHYFGVDFGDQTLDKDGNWIPKKNGNPSNTVTFGYTEMPEFMFTTENGVVTEVAFYIDIENSEEILGSYNLCMLLSACSFAGAQDEMTLFSKLLDKIVRQIPNTSFKNFNFEEAGIEFDYQVEYSGYNVFSNHFLTLNKDSKDHFLKLNFTMTKVE